MTQSCESCTHSYMADALVLCCDLEPSLPCSPVGCQRYSYEPGADAQEIPWYQGGWDQGRGD